MFTWYHIRCSSLGPLVAIFGISLFFCLLRFVLYIWNKRIELNWIEITLSGISVYLILLLSALEFTSLCNVQSWSCLLMIYNRFKLSWTLLTFICTVSTVLLFFIRMLFCFFWCYSCLYVVNKERDIQIKGTYKNIATNNQIIKI